MNEERFQRDLHLVLHEIAGGGAPPSLRYRLAEVVAQPPGRRSWFRPPLQLATATAAVVVVALLALFLVPGGILGPAASGSPTPSVSPSATPSASPSATTSPTPSPSASPAQTPAPTPVPTAVQSSWTAIKWNNPFEPFPIRAPVDVGQKVTVPKLHNVLAWNGAFVGVGSISHGFQCEEAAFFHSADGVTWTVTDRFSSGDQFVSAMCPDYIVATPDRLLAIGQRRIWSSTDGVDWTEIDSPSWRALWTSNLPQLMGVSSGPSGVVAIGVDPDSGKSLVAHSSAGASWQRVNLPAEELPIVRDVASYRGGFVIVGRDGQPDGEASSAHPAVVPGMGRAAAWTSSNGVTWTEASVQADRVQGGGMTQLLIGSDGLFAVGINTGADYYPDGDYAAGRTITAWASIDGTSWEIAGALGKDLPPMGRMLASDGTHMVALGLRQSAAFLGIEGWVEQAPTAWTSTDGRHWNKLTVSGKAPEVDFLGLEPQLLDNPPDSALWVLPHGLLAMGRGDGVPINEPNSNQWFRFAAVVP